MRILGIDPGLVKTGWGVIELDGNSLSYVASGLIKSKASEALYVRLSRIDFELTKIVRKYAPDSAAIEETFVNSNAASALKLGFARGVAIVAPAREGLCVGEYSATLVKKSIVGTGHAEKKQIGMMIRRLLPNTSGVISEDEADALAVAVCHANHEATAEKVRRGGA